MCWVHHRREEGFSVKSEPAHGHNPPAKRGRFLPPEIECWNFGGSFFYPDKSYLGLPPRTMLNLSKLFFGALSSGIFILPFFSDMISKNFKTLFTNTLIFRITLLVVCLIAAYKLSYSYSAEYISYPQARLSDRIEKPKILIWSTENTFFYLNCDGSLKLEGVRNDKIFFSRDVDGYRNRGPCRGLKN